MLCISCHFIPLRPLTLGMDHAKLLDVLMSLPVSHAILPRTVCFATSRPANHAICIYIDSSAYAFWPIRIYLFIDYMIMVFIALVSSQGSDEPAHSCSLVRDFAACINKMQRYMKARPQYRYLSSLYSCAQI